MGTRNVRRINMGKLNTLKIENKLYTDILDTRQMKWTGKDTFSQKVYYSQHEKQRRSSFAFGQKGYLQKQQNAIK